MMTPEQLRKKRQQRRILALLKHELKMQEEDARMIQEQDRRMEMLIFYGLTGFIIAICGLAYISDRL